MVNNNKKYIRLYRKYRMYRALAILSIKPFYIYHSIYISRGTYPLSTNTTHRMIGV